MTHLCEAHDHKVSGGYEGACKAIHTAVSLAMQPVSHESSQVAIWDEAQGNGAREIDLPITVANFSAFFSETPQNSAE